MITFPAVFDITQHPFGQGALTSDGVQWSTEVDTTTANTDVVVGTAEIDARPKAKMSEVEFSLTAAFKAVSSATADLIWKWQARQVGKTNWVDLHAAVTETNIGTTYVERTRKGYYPVTPGKLEDIPIEVRLILQCNEANEGRAKIKNSSYARLVWSSEG